MRWDGVLRTFDDPGRKPGEPWLSQLSPEGHQRLNAELDELRERPEQFARAAVACQGLSKAYLRERDEMITAAVDNGCSVPALAKDLGCTRQHVYAIAAKMRKAR